MRRQSVAPLVVGGKRHAEGRRETDISCDAVDNGVGDVGYIKLVRDILAPEHHTVTAAGEVDSGLEIQERVGGKCVQSRIANR